MPFPTDPVRAAECRAKMREAARRRWEDDKQRQNARQHALEQWRDPVKRKRIADALYTRPASIEKWGDNTQRIMAYRRHRERQNLIKQRAMISCAHEPPTSPPAS